VSNGGGATGLEARTTVVDSGSFQFIIDYEQTNHLTIRKSVCSDLISAVGHDWMIKWYPRGSKDNNNGEYLSIYLVLRSKSAALRVIFKASVIGRYGKPASLKARSLVHVFTSKDKRGSYSGWSRFAK
jgi:speckle-type POZ protein